jgi:chaperone required for assembly of F1-ATPase
MSTPDRGNTTPDVDVVPAKVLGREPLRPPLPKKFYTTASVAAEGPLFAVQLDGRGVRTPKKLRLALPTHGLAAAIAAEWQAQAGVIDPSTMPLTKMANTVIDGVIGAEAALVDEITRFSGSDLLCYPAQSPPALVDRQAAQWRPLLARMEERLGGSFAVMAGLMPIVQPAATLSSVAKRLNRCDAYQLAAVHVMTTLTGSAILAIARLDGEVTAAEAWQLAHLDEDFQIELWGADDEALSRRAFRWLEMQAADRLLLLVD